MKGKKLTKEAMENKKQNIEVAQIVRKLIKIIFMIANFWAAHDP